MANISYPASLSNGSTADATAVMAFFNAITAQVNGNIEALNMANATITGAKIANDTITATQIAPDAIGQSELGPLSVGTPELIDDSVTAAKIATDAVGAPEIATDAVGQAEIAASAVGAGEVKFNNSSNNLSVTATTGGADTGTITPAAGTYMVVLQLQAITTGTATTCLFQAKKNAAAIPATSVSAVVLNVTATALNTDYGAIAFVTTFNGTDTLKVTATSGASTVAANVAAHLFGVLN
jgi:hypothetical protein